MLDCEQRPLAPGETDPLEPLVNDHLLSMPSPRPSSDQAAPRPSDPRPSDPRPSDHWLVQQLHEQREAADRTRLAALLTTAPTPA